MAFILIGISESVSFWGFRFREIWVSPVVVKVFDWVCETVDVNSVVVLLYAIRGK